MEICFKNIKDNLKVSKNKISMIIWKKFPCFSNCRKQIYSGTSKHLPRPGWGHEVIKFAWLQCGWVRGEGRSLIENHRLDYDAIRIYEYEHESTLLLDGVCR